MTGGSAAGGAVVEVVVDVEVDEVVAGGAAVMVVVVVDVGEAGDVVVDWLAPLPPPQPAALSSATTIATATLDGHLCREDSCVTLMDSPFGQGRSSSSITSNLTICMPRPWR
jgi:hypothetical protein